MQQNVQETEAGTDQNVGPDQVKNVNNVDNEINVQSSDKSEKNRQAEKKKGKKNKDSFSQSVDSVVSDVLMGENMSEDTGLNHRSSKRKIHEKEQSSAKAKKKRWRLCLTMMSVSGHHHKRMRPFCILLRK